MSDEQEDKRQQPQSPLQGAVPSPRKGADGAPQSYLSYIISGRKDLAKSVTGGLAHLGLIDPDEHPAQAHEDQGGQSVNPQHAFAGFQPPPVPRPPEIQEGGRRKRTGTTREFGKVELPPPSEMLTAGSASIETSFDRAAAERAALERAAYERDLAERDAYQRAAQERAAYEKAAFEKAAAERAAYEREAAERANQERAIAERAAHERAAAEKAAYERAVAERAAYERAEAERAAYERAQAERAAYEQAQAERAAFERQAASSAAAERAALERQAAEQAALQRAAAERAAFEKALAEKAALEKAEAEKQALEQAAAERAAWERAAAEQAALEKAAAERAELEKAAAQQAALAKAAEERAAIEKAAVEKAELEKAAAAKAEAERAEAAARKMVARVVQDDKGTVTEIHYSDGASRHIAYDDESNVASVRDKDGTSWINQGGILWVQFLAEGKPTGNVWEGKVSVNEQGDYIYEDGKDSSRVVERMDGSRLIEEADAGTIEVNAGGLVCALHYGNGTTRSFKYDDDGNLIHVLDHHGTMLRKDGQTLQWQRFDVEGRPTKSATAGTAMVDEQGNFIFEEADTGATIVETLDGKKITQGRDGYTVTEYADGSRDVVCPDQTEMRLMKDGTIITKTPDGSMAQRPDGVRIEADPNGIIKRVHNKDKSMLEFDYDNNGEMSAFTDTDGSSWRRKRIDMWIYYNEHGKEAGRHSTGSISVNEIGQVTVSLTSADPVVIPNAARAEGGVVQAVEESQSEPPRADDARLDERASIGRAGDDGGAGESGADESDQSDSSGEESNWLSGLESAEAEFETEQVAEERPLPAGTTRIEIDSNGRVQRVDYPNQSRKEFEYSDDEGLIAIRDDAGRSLTKNSDNTWTTFADDGSILSTSGEAEVIVDREGNLITRYLDEGYSTIQRPDSTALRIDADGQLLLFLTPEKRKFSVIARGIAQYKMPEGDNAEGIARDVYRLQNWITPFAQPTPEQLEGNLLTIARANKLRSLDDAQPGDQLIVPIPHRTWQP